MIESMLYLTIKSKKSKKQKENGYWYGSDNRRGRNRLP